MMILDIYRGQTPADLATYSITEAAHCLHLPPATVRSWVKGRTYSRHHGRVLSTPLVAIADSSRLLLSFNNLIELHVLSTIRRHHCLKMSVVRRGLDFLRDRFESERPLLDQKMLTDGQALFVNHAGDLVVVSSHGQMALREILNEYLERIDRDASGHPTRLFPFTRPRIFAESPRVVAIDPRIRFGRPCIVGTNLPTSMISGRHQAGDSIEDLAVDYDRQPWEIEEAILYERRPAA